MDNIEIITLYSYEAKIKDYITVIPYPEEVETCSYNFKSTIVKKQNFSFNNINQYFNFYYRKMEGHLSDYILKALRIKDDNCIGIALFSIFLRELIVSDTIPYNVQDNLLNLYRNLNIFIKDKYYLEFDSKSKFSCNFININLIPHINIYKNEELNIEALCLLNNLCWKEFFLENCIIERLVYQNILYGLSLDSTSDKPIIEKKDWVDNFYNSNWVGYIIKNGEKVILKKVGLKNEYQPIAEIVLQKKFDKHKIEKGQIVFLDGDNMNIDDENIALFRNYGDYIRYCEGNCSYKIDNDSICYVDSEITKNEFFSLYLKYSLANLQKIYGLTANGINKLIKKFAIPPKKELHIV